jgi:hypothetical protein
MTPEQVNLANWLFGLSDHEYQKQHREHLAKTLGLASAAELDAKRAEARNKRIKTDLVNTSEMLNVEWQWPGYMPSGKLVIIDGDPGCRSRCSLFATQSAS